MRRRAYLAALTSASSAAIAGCEAAPPVGTTPTDGATPTDDPRRTVRVGPSGPGCPGDSWGQMAAMTESYEDEVEDAAAATELLTTAADHGGEFTRVTPRPDGVEWKDRTVYVAETYDADDWFLFTTGNGVDLVGALVVSLAGGGAEVVFFYVGAC